MSKKFVIVHHEMGIYLGSFLGLGFFSALDCTGQTEAVAFETYERAHDYVKSWADHNDTSEYRFHAVDTENDRYATIEELDIAGLSHLTKPMIDERLKNMPAAGSA